jgi:uncharacterized membrane protein YeaQ/YmgE (transglycosylase-associated protein family)
MPVQMGAVMRTQEEIYNAKGERIYTQEELRRQSAEAGVTGLDSKNIVIAVLMGLCAGWLASFIVGGGGVFQYLVSGVLGSFVGSFALQKFGINLGIRNEIGRDIATATIGAIIVMVVAHLLT